MIFAAFSDLNYPILLQSSMVPKMFEPVRLETFIASIIITCLTGKDERIAVSCEIQDFLTTDLH